MTAAFHAVDDNVAPFGSGLNHGGTGAGHSPDNCAGNGTFCIVHFIVGYSCQRAEPCPDQSIVARIAIDIAALGGERLAGFETVKFSDTPFVGPWCPQPS